MEDLLFMRELFIPIVMAICLSVGYILKNWTKDVENRIIPTVLAVLGMACACIHFREISLDAVAAGAVTGLASTGFHQLFKQLIEKE